MGLSFAILLHRSWKIELLSISTFVSNDLFNLDLMCPTLIISQTQIATILQSTVVRFQTVPLKFLFVLHGVFHRLPPTPPSSLPRSPHSPSTYPFLATTTPHHTAPPATERAQRFRCTTLLILMWTNHKHTGSKINQNWELLILK